MDNTVIILIIIGVLIVYIATSFMAKMIKLTVKIFLIIIVLMAILMILFYRDIDDIKKSISHNNNTFILYEDGVVYSAITLDPVVDSIYSLDSFRYFNRTEISILEERIRNDSLSPISEQNIFIINPKLLKENYSINISVLLNEKDLMEIIRSDDPYLTMATKMKPTFQSNISTIKDALIKSYGSEEKMKGYLFAALLVNELQSKNTNLIRELKNKNLIIIPESMSFRIIRKIPFI